MASKVIWICVVLYFLADITFSNVFDSLLDSGEPCKEACDKTYPLHTYPNPKHSECCKRGCRFFTLVDLIDDGDNINATRDACMASCMEAYSQTVDRYACNIGCANQVPSVDYNKQAMVPEEQPQTMHLLTPFMYVHNIYNNMMDRMSRIMSVSWSFYMQADNGKVVVLQSEPEIITEYLDMDDGEDKSKDDSNSEGADDSLIISSIGSNPGMYEGSKSDDSDSVPDIYFYHQQSLSGEASSNELPVRITVSAYATNEEVHSVDWLGCVSRKSGLPRWLLGLIIFLSAMVMVWLCFATTVTAPEQHVRQILSVNGDLEYLTSAAAQQEKVKIQPSYERLFTDDYVVKVKLDQA